MIYASFTDAPNETSVARRQQWENDTQSYYDYVSYGELNLRFDHTPTLDLGVSKEQITNEGSFALRERMRNAATAAGYALSDFEILVYNFPASVQIGGGAVATSGYIIFPGNFESSGLIHEMGHALTPGAVGHPSVLEAGDVAYPSSPDQATNGGSTPFNMMGSGGGEGAGSGNWGHPANLPPWNLPNKYKVGWVRDADFHDARTSGVYRIYNNDVANPTDLQVGRMLGARIKLGSGYEVGAQNPDLMIGFQPQNNYRSDAAARGVTIEAFSDEISFLIDATPNSAPETLNPTPVDPTSAFADMVDSYLTVGNTVELPSLGYKISVVATGGSGADAWIDIRVETGESAATLAPSLSVRSAAVRVPLASSTVTDLPVAELVILGGAADPAYLSLAGADASHFVIRDSKLYIKSGTPLSTLSQTQLNVDVVLDDPAFAGVEKVRSLSFDLSNDALRPANGQLGNPGLNYERFAATGDMIPRTLPTVIDSRVAANIEIPANTADRLRGYRWSGLIDIPSEGLYQFLSTNSFHGRMYIDGRLVLDSATDVGSFAGPGDTASSHIGLAAGPHEITYIFFGNNQNILTLNVEWDGPTFDRERIPNSVLFRPYTGPNQTPSVTGGSFSVDETVEIGTVVGQITASDPDGDLIYFSIVGGNTNDSFEIDNQGTIRTREVLSHGVIPNYELIVEASDLNAADTSNVFISLNDITIDTPLFDLADIIGGGNGTLPGTATQSTVVGRGTSEFSTNPAAMIDGVFVPRASGSTVVSSTGLTTDLTSMVLNDSSGGDIVSGNPSQNFLSGATLNGIQIPNLSDEANHSVISIRPSQGITFDLDLIRRLSPGELSRFTAIAAAPNFLVNTAYAVLLDGVQVAGRVLVQSDAERIDIPIAATNRFLTLVSANGKSGASLFSNLYFVDPFVQVSPLALPGDFNSDGTVDLADYSKWRDTVGASVPVYTGADASGDGLVDMEDYNIWKSNFGRTLPTSTSLALAVSSSNSTNETMVEGSVEMVSAAVEYPATGSAGSFALASFSGHTREGRRPVRAVPDKSPFTNLPPQLEDLAWYPFSQFEAKGPEFHLRFDVAQVSKEFAFDDYPVDLDLLVGFARKLHRYL